jgi:small subunit ribosomal protein S5
MLSKHHRRKAEEFDTQFQEKALHINRCSKVVKGGRKFSFSALVVVGDGQGHIGYGFAKANELTIALEKAGKNARSNIITVNFAGSTIPHEITVRYDGTAIMMRPAKSGAGLVAGSQTRVILELAGFKDVVAKVLGSSNPMNQVHAVFQALEQLIDRNEYMESRKVGGAA